ncbi:MAG: tetratricopeptide repeat protein [Polyangiaceae bacterium]
MGGTSVRGRLGAVLLTACLVATVPRSAAAQSGVDRAAAQALFDEGIALRDAGRIREACAKLDESLRLDPGVGTRFNLADCLERDGRLASAWSHFLEVVAATQMAGQADRAAAARQRADALEPRLTRLRLTPQQPAPGLVVMRNGVPVGSPQWGTPVPVDPGPYVIEAQAPGKQPYRVEIDVRGEGQLIEATVPPLLDAPAGATPSGPGIAPPPPAPDATTSDTGVSGTTIAGITVTAVGAVGLGVGAAFGLIAMSKKNRVDELCPDERRCTTEGIAINDQARTAGHVSTATFIAGGALAATGLVLWLAFPSETSGSGANGRLRLAVAPLAGPGLGGLAFAGRW